MDKRKLEGLAQKLVDGACAFDGDKIEIVHLAAQMGFCVGEADMAEGISGIVAVDKEAESLLGSRANMVIATRRGMEGRQRRLAIARLLARYLLRQNKGAPIFAAQEVVWGYHPPGNLE